MAAGNSEAKRPNEVDDPRLIGFAESVIEREAQQPIADILANGAVANITAEFLAHLTEMQGLIVENARNPA